MLAGLGRRAMDNTGADLFLLAPFLSQVLRKKEVFLFTPHAPTMLTDRTAIWSGTPADTENSRLKQRVQYPYTAITGWIAIGLDPLVVQQDKDVYGETAC